MQVGDSHGRRWPGSERHLRDIARMVLVSGELIAQPVLAEWIGRLELGEAWRKALAFGDR
jgi:hypothetical protein